MVMNIRIIHYMQIKSASEELEPISVIIYLNSVDQTEYRHAKTAQ